MKLVTLLFRLLCLFSVVLIPSFSHRLYLFSPFFSPLPLFLAASLSVFAAFPFFHGFALLWVNANGLYDVMKIPIKDHIVSFPPRLGVNETRSSSPVASRASVVRYFSRSSKWGVTAAVHQDLHSQRVPVPNSLATRAITFDVIISILCRGGMEGARARRGRVHTAERETSSWQLLPSHRSPSTSSPRPFCASALFEFNGGHVCGELAVHGSALRARSTSSTLGESANFRGWRPGSRRA